MFNGVFVGVGFVVVELVVVVVVGVVVVVVVDPLHSFYLTVQWALTNLFHPQ